MPLPETFGRGKSLFIRCCALLRFGMHRASRGKLSRLSITLYLYPRCLKFHKSCATWPQSNRHEQKKRKNQDLLLLRAMAPKALRRPMAHNNGLHRMITILHCMHCTEGGECKWGVRGTPPPPEVGVKKYVRAIWGRGATGAMYP